MQWVRYEYYEWLLTFTANRWLGKGQYFANLLTVGSRSYIVGFFVLTR